MPESVGWVGLGWAVVAVGEVVDVVVDVVFVVVGEPQPASASALIKATAATFVVVLTRRVARTR